MCTCIFCYFRSLRRLPLSLRPEPRLEEEGEKRSKRTSASANCGFKAVAKAATVTRVTYLGPCHASFGPPLARLWPTFGPPVADPPKQCGLGQKTRVDEDRQPGCFEIFASCRPKEGRANKPTLHREAKRSLVAPSHPLNLLAFYLCLVIVSI